MPLIRWRPFAELDELFEDMRGLSNSWDLAADVYEENGNIVVEMNVPGIDPDKVSIELEDHHLKVSGLREEEEETEDKNYYRKEIRRGSFERIIPVPSGVAIEKTMAEFSDGVLKISLPKKEAKGPNKIKVKRKK